MADIFPVLSTVDATEDALRSATWLRPEHSAAVALLRKLAAAVDAIDENGLNPAGKLDNVSSPLYLRALAELRLTPGPQDPKTKAPPLSTDTDHSTGKAKAKRGARGGSNVTALRGPLAG